MDNETVDISKINLKNKRLKLQNTKAAQALLSSISERGILDPLLGYFENDQFVLVDGFKRYNCCKKLHIATLPIEQIATDEASAFIKTLNISNSKSLHILEQAKFINELQIKYKMTGVAIAQSLEKSTNWVSTRLTLLKEMTPLEEEKIFNGLFPVWCSMGVLHKCKRSNIANSDDVDTFIKAVSGKSLSVKDIELLANGYFKGGDELKKQIETGNLSWSMNKLKDFENQPAGLNDDEKRILKDLEIASKYMGRIIFKLPQLKNNNQFFSTAGILTEGILDKLDRFQVTLKTFIQEVENDQRRQGKGCMDSS